MMIATSTFTQEYQCLAQLLAYPAEQAAAKLATHREQVAAGCPSAAQDIDRFVHAAQPLSRGAWEELYTRTFDLAPICTLYVSVYLFGAENYQRGQLMARLAEAFDRHGIDRQGELPDHLGVLMLLLAALPDDERRELIHYCLQQPVKTMIGTLTKADNPYRFVLQAVQHLLEADLGGEQNHA